MKELFTKTINSKFFKRMVINLAFTNPRLSTAECIELREALRNLDNDVNEEIQLKKAS